MRLVIIFFNIHYNFYTHHCFVELLSCIWLFCNPTDCSLPGSSVHGISQAKVLEWLAIAFSRGFFQPRDQTHISCIGKWILYQWAAREIPLNSYMLLLLLLEVASVVFHSVRPHGQQPTRLPRPWDSPGKNTGVGCHFFLKFMKVKSESEVPQSCRLFTTPWAAAYQAPLSMGFSRPEYWSGVPLPSPIYSLG